jgi:hypothetical protein
MAGVAPGRHRKLVDGGDDEPLRAALAALRRPIAPKASPHVAAQIERLCAHLAARAGDRDAAARHGRTAVGLMGDAGVPFDAAVLALELADYVDDGESRDVIAQAIVTFDRLGAEPWQKRARRLVV